MIERRFETAIMHRAVTFNGLIFLGGIVAAKRTPDIADQTRQILTQMADYLLDAGSDEDHVLSATVYLLDMAHKSRMNEAWNDFFRAECLPARATVEVSSLGHEATLIELSVVAAVLQTGSGYP